MKIHIALFVVFLAAPVFADGPFPIQPANIGVVAPLSKSSTGNNLTLSLISSGYISPSYTINGMALSGTGITVSSGGSLAANAPLFISGGTGYSLGIGTNLSLSGTNLQAGTAAFGTAAYSPSSSFVPYSGATGSVNLGSNALIVSGTSAIIETPLLALYATSGTTSAFAFSSTTGQFIVAPIASTGAFQVLTGLLGTPVFNVDTLNSRVGIGTTTPSQALDLASGNFVTTGKDTAGYLTVTGSSSIDNGVIVTNGAGLETFSPGLGLQVKIGAADTTGLITAISALTSESVIICNGTTSLAVTGASAFSGGMSLSSVGTGHLAYSNSSSNLVGVSVGSGLTLSGTVLSTSASYLSSVSVNGPITGSGTSGSPLTIAVATSAANGYLSSADWTTFNGKQASGSYLTSISGTNGVTITSGSIAGLTTISGSSLLGNSSSSSGLPTSITVSSPLTMAGGTLSAGTMSVTTLAGSTQLNLPQYVNSATSPLLITSNTNGSWGGQTISLSSSYSSMDLTAQTAAVSSVLSVTAPNDGSSHTFTVGGYITVTADAAANTVTLQVTYTDENSNSQTLSFYGMGTTTAGIAATGASNFPPTTIRVKANNSVTVKTTVTGVGSQTYDVGGWIQRVN